MDGLPTVQDFLGVREAVVIISHIYRDDVPIPASLQGKSTTGNQGGNRK